jgi:ribonuclease J
MKIIIHRGLEQIGGNIIEISTDKTRILFDIGLELEDDKNKKLPEIVGLFDRKGFDAIFISHYHSDHLGLVYEVFPDIPIYIGENSYRIVSSSDAYKGVETISPTGFLTHGTPIRIGDIKITPYLCDHSAFDSYMLFAEAEGENVLYSGDFRSNGRKPFDWLLSQLPTNIDTLICEGTTLSRDNYVCQTEKDLEIEAVNLFSKHTGPIFILQSSMNIDRIVTMYRSAKRTKRKFLEELYMAEIVNSIGGNIPNPIDFFDVKVFVTHSLDKESARYRLFDKYGINKIGKSQIAKQHFVMCVRTSMLNYLFSLSRIMSFENGLLVYSFWSGYRIQPEMINFINRCEAMGLKVVTLHTSGHADAQTIKALIDKVNPKKIIPVHTENADWFSTNYFEKC